MSSNAGSSFEARHFALYPKEKIDTYIIFFVYLGGIKFIIYKLHSHIYLSL